MTLIVNVIRKVSGNFQVAYTGKTSSIIGTDTTPRDVTEAAPVKITRTGRKLSKPAAPVAVVAPAPVAPVATPAPKALEYWTMETIGNVEPTTSGKYHTLQINNSDDLLYRGKLLPYTMTRYPLWVVVDADNQIVKSDYTNSDQTSLKVAIFYDLGEAVKAAKSLPAKVRKLTAKSGEIEEINLNAKGTAERFEVYTKTLLNAVKKCTKKVYLDISGYLFPASTLAAVCRVSDSDNMTVTVKADYDNVITIGTFGNSRTETVKTPALIIRHGNTKTTILGKLSDNYARNTYQIVPVTL